MHIYTRLMMPQSVWQSGKLLLILLLLFGMNTFVSGQSNGKIAGVVVDKASGEPLPGVNVTLENTLLGSTTDLDGYYVILNVPVSTFDIRASYVGYRDMVFENIRVSANITTDINFELDQTTLELGEAVVVIGQRPLVEKNVTQSYSLVTSDAIEAMPVRGVQNIINLQASVVVQDGNVYIRGGRSNETGYYLDGASITNPLNNASAVNIIHDAVEEIQVLVGGYTAEFGGANSGIVRSELKTGSSEYHFSLDMQTDKFVKSGEQFLSTNSFQDHILTGTFSGPLWSNKIRFYSALENTYEGDWVKRFSEGFRFDESNLENPLVDGNRRNANVIAGHPDTVKVLEYIDGFTPKNKRNRWTTNNTLLFDLKPLQFRLSGVYTWQELSNNPTPILDMLNFRERPNITNNVLLSGKITHVLNPTTFYDLNVSYFYNNNETEDDYFGTDWRSWSDSAKVANHTNGRVTYRDQFRQQYDYELNGFPLSRDGSLVGNYITSEQTYIGGVANIVSQVTRYHEAKAGVDVRYYTLRRFSINPQVISLTNQYGTEEAVPEAAWKEFTSNIYGYDRFGKKIDGGFDGPKHPLFLAFYLQDKIEFKDLIINAGLRFDYFDTDDRELKDPANPEIIEAEGTIAESAWKDLDPFQQISPRLGLSFPISDNTVFYTQYGKFIQMPELDNIYFNSRDFGTQIVSGGNYYIQPIGFGIGPMRTTSYEIGFRQSLSSVAAIDVTGFYKNTKGQITVERQAGAPGALITTYDYLTNGDFATTKGVEIRLNLRRSKRLQAQMNYTYTSAEGTGSGETSYHGAVYRNTVKPTITSPLDFNQTHRGSINLDYRFGPGDGGKILENFGANVLFTFNSGHPYTKVTWPSGGQVNAYEAGVDYMLDTRDREAIEAINSSTTPWNFNVDLRLDKSVKVWEKLNSTFYVRINNLFNIQNVINVYEGTGSAEDDGFISNPARSSAFVNTYGGQDYINMYRAINLDNGQAYWDNIGRQLYANPRQILFGVRLVY
ncbi:MAG: TonB-dependent receptor [Calditrichaceae bacterium]